MLFFFAAQIVFIKEGLHGEGHFVPPDRADDDDFVILRHVLNALQELWLYIFPLLALCCVEDFFVVPGIVVARVDFKEVYVFSKRIDDSHGDKLGIFKVRNSRPCVSGGTPLFQQSFNIFFNICATSAGKIFSAFKVRAFSKFCKVSSAAAKTAATTGTKSNHFFARPVLAFHKGINNFRRISPPDWITEHNSVIA